MEQNRVLYWSSLSAPSWRARILLEEKGIFYESKHVSLGEGEHKGPEVLAINPRGQVPTFKDGDAVVNESGAILLYLESQYPQNTLIPSDVATKARVYQVLFEVAATESRIRPYAFAKFGGIEDPNEEEHVEMIKGELDMWNSHAGKYKFIASDSFTLADVMYGPVVVGLEVHGLQLDKYPNLKKYYEAVKDRPSLVKTWPAAWLGERPAIQFMSVF